MPSLRPLPLFFLAFLSLGSLSLFAKEPAAPTEKKEKEDTPKKTEELAEPVVSHGSLKAAGLNHAYTAEAGTIALKKDDGTESARVFYVSYTVKGEESANRPVAFCFNGGPGSCAVWLHLGGLGPKRIDIPKDGTGWPEPPFDLKANPHSVLPTTDLVFIDPVSTGYSRATKPEEASKEFHGFKQDVESVGEFIRLWVTKNGRWGSPKFLVGESYGAIRAAGLADHLQDRHGMYLNGVVLVSGLLDFGTLRATEGNDRPYTIFLPRMTALAHYHGKLEGDFDALVKESQDFADGDLTHALLLGDQLPQEERKAVAKTLARLTAMPVDLIERSQLRLESSVFRKQLLKKEGLIIGRFDGRVTAPARDHVASYAHGDPSYDNVYGAFSTAMNTYLRKDLKVESEETYEVLGGRLRGWDYAPFENRFATVGNKLVSAMESNPHLKVMVNGGRHDLATPPEGVEQSLAQLGLDPSLRKNISFTYYDGGHMFYTHPTSMKQWGLDFQKFLKNEAEERPAKRKKAPENGE